MNKKYSELNSLNDKSKQILEKRLKIIIDSLKYTDFLKFEKLMDNSLEILKVTYDSEQHSKQRPKRGKLKNTHPIKPIRGEIYNAFLGENAGSELSGEHPVIVIQNARGNLFAQKVIVLPIEGDGNEIDESYMMKVTTDDLENDDFLTKNPSRFIVSEIMTIDKAKLGAKIGKLKPEKIFDLNSKIYSQLSLDIPKQSDIIKVQDNIKSR